MGPARSDLREGPQQINQHLSDLVRAHQGIIRAFLARLCRDSGLADDLAQDTFLKAFQNIDQLQHPKAAKAWLFQIAYHAYLAHSRKQARRRALAQMENGDENNAEADLSQSHNGAAIEGARLDIHRAMATLPPEQRGVILMCLSYGMSHSEAAKASGLPLGTVKSHINRGRSTLRASLSAYEKV